MLNAEIKQINRQCELHVIDIPVIDNKLSDCLDKYLVSICEGDSDSELQLVKYRLKKFFDGKNESTKMGAVAEFFVHLYLQINGYKQEFLFLI
ncbi:conserved hypothetical protein [Photobacterium leiognathi lrivu.4.1]|uniref:Uncharacterized protein n=1 Tax=Photobacterium leiognathi lrivu.4.1 TaxID=1248232 RepID=V5ER19_PHOLE|nr:hypothetical protein [Photobacterium leiognathi]GAD32236.1 conserved hypothetical protein [Photobacterium leiognathi lrivu.4.1]